MQQQTMINPVTVGLRFNPTDTELMLLLNKKINNQPLTCDYIRTVDVYKYNPWELADTNTSWGDDGLMYFFTPRDRKYMNGSRPNRAAGDGFWKATAIGKKICDNNECIGLKRTLVFYQGKASNGKKTNWIMHEYTINQPPRHPTGSMRLDDCVLCRIRERKPAAAASDSCKTIRETSESENLTSHKRSRTESDQQHDVPAQHHLHLRQPDLPLMHQQFQQRQPDLPLMHQQNQTALQYTSQQHGSVPQQQQNQPGGELDYSVQRRLEEIEHFLMDDLENDDEGVLIDN
ncbi:NAC transcription factor 32-like [Primulina tabacum]|uniref:NAC transcription factor 32-like n=1 Tax=Primulina tabacum TaxID=48773 RepID=UPI003F596198